MRKYCAMDYVFLVTVKGRESSRDPEWSQFRVEVEKPYKKPPRGKKASRGLRLRRGKRIIFILTFYKNNFHVNSNFPPNLFSNISKSTNSTKCFSYTLSLYYHITLICFEYTVRRKSLGTFALLLV